MNTAAEEGLYMPTFKKILVPTDFSEYSQYALKYACAFAKISGGSIECVHVVDTTFLATSAGSVYANAGDAQRSIDAFKAQAKKELDHFIRKERLLGVDVKPHLREGIAGDEIVKLADEIHADLIVIPTHGRSGLDRLVFGSVCDKVLRLSKVPVLAIKHPEHEALAKDGSLSLKRVLCPIDFSVFSHGALPLARELCKKFGATLVLAHIVDARFDYPEWTAQVAMNNTAQLLESAKENLGRTAKEIKDVKTEIYVATGIPAHSLVNYASESKIDLVLIPTHGRKGLAHALLGSVAERVVRGAPCPVMTVRPKA
jgi:nucleotide-binding universal stress UspA family protein